MNQKAKIGVGIAAILIVLGSVIPIFYFDFFSPAETSVTIELWYTYEGSNVMEGRVREFESLHPDVQVIFHEQPSSGWLDKFVSVAQTGNTPDVFLTKASWLGELAELGYAAPLTAFLTPEQEAHYHPKGIEGLSYLNELWALPLWFDSILLFYNRQLFEQEGVTVPNEDWTDLDFRDAAVELTDLSDEQNEAFGVAWNILSPFMWPSFQHGLGHGTLYQNDTITVNDATSAATMQFLYEMKHSSPTCMGYDDSSYSATQAFISNKAAMLIYGGWFIPTLDSLGMDYGLQILPTVASTGERISPLVEVKGWGMSMDTQYPSLSYELMCFLSNSETQEDMLAAEFKVPTLVSLLETPEITEDPRLSIQVDQIDFSQYQPLDPIYGVYCDYIRAALQFILRDHMDIQTALDDAQVGIDAYSGGA